MCTIAILIGVAEAPVVLAANRDEIYAEQAKRYPGFGEYEEKVAGARTIPVLALRRQS